VVVQHIPIGFSQALAEQLDSKSQIKVCHAQEGELLRPGHAYIAKAGFDLSFRKQGSNVVLHLEKGTTPLPPGGLRPSADVMMTDAARVYGHSVLGVIMTGMGRDGEKGMKEIKKRKGRTIAEAESTCVVYGMPKAAAEAKVVDKVVPLGKIAQEIMNTL
jgi:two-component system chemotaxis response regulator CheB